MNVTTPPSPRFSPALVASTWLVAASLVGFSGILPRVPLVAPLSIFSLVLGFVVAYRRSPALRARVAEIDPRVLIALHVVRAPIGLSFLWLYSLGLLPALFAVRAGIGDTIVGLLAIAAVLVPSRRGRLVWNTVGLIDIALSFSTAMKVIFIARDPVALATMGRYPFPLVPLFVVPVVVLTHLALFTKLTRLRAR